MWGVSAHQGAFSKDFDVIDGSEWLFLLTYNFTANFDYFVKHVVDGESECAKPGRDIEYKDWFNQTFVNLKFAKLTEEEKTLLTFRKDVVT